MVMNYFVLQFVVPDKKNFNNSISHHQVGVTSLLRVHCVFLYKLSYP